MVTGSCSSRPGGAVTAVTRTVGRDNLGKSATEWSHTGSEARRHTQFLEYLMAGRVPSRGFTIIREKYRAWYENEHIPLLVEARDWLRVRRYRIESGEGGGWTHLVLHELALLKVMSLSERISGRKDPTGMPSRTNCASIPLSAGNTRRSAWLRRQ
jgi:hypothetical protein